MSLADTANRSSLADLARRYFQPEYGHFIGGQWTAGDSGQTIPILSPATGQEIARIAAGNAADCDRAVDAAYEAFKSWGTTSPYERQAILFEMGRRLQARGDDFAMMETLDNGKTITESQMCDIPMASGMFGVYAGAISELRGDTVDLPGATMLTHREPYGVCVQIIPWNIPLISMAFKLGPALAAGNTVVLKPAESTCLSVLEFIKEISDLIPPGVVNVVTGYGPDVGEPLVTNPKVRKVAFTGSRPTARAIMGYAQKHIIPQTLELGGKSAMIVCDDADLDLAVEGAVMSTVFMKGEVCLAGSRIFVHDKVYDEFMSRFAGIVSQVRHGDPTDAATQLGPQASLKQLERVLHYLELGPREGATVATGGHRATVKGLEGGYFLEPTIFTDVHNDMTIAKDEIFGPVACVMPWKTEEQVLSLANESIYGLGGGIYSSNLGRTHRLVRGLQTGTIWVNRYYNFVQGQAFGGFKESGFGREGSAEALQHYTHTKGVVINLDETPLGLFG
ncbi:aldehyde dehydrogenase family protein [Mycobacterium paraintracellulare]|uniref:aldehyde dehydrogenase family protein n=1 Tax=Mycobacterium paraintracellulare TaxID=1138383 RepID=UPI0019280723|nr:aldehyde dehydrogenase family protein [Mycobacterium paraintracellulare]BCP14194.1 aldehyde dehydrogenase [Mycobacterium paraintracellulare]